MKPKHKKGFTLIELLVVISILAVLSSIALYALQGARIKARDARRKQDLKQLSTAIMLYYDKHGAYPVAENDALPFFADTTVVGSFLNVLVSEGFLSKDVIDPLNSSNYYIYAWDGGTPTSLTYRQGPCGANIGKGSVLMFRLEGGISNDYVSSGGWNAICFY